MPGGGGDLCSPPAHTKCKDLGLQYVCVELAVLQVSFRTECIGLWKDVCIVEYGPAHVESPIISMLPLGLNHF